MTRVPAVPLLFGMALLTMLCGCGGLAAWPAVPPGNDWTTLAGPAPGALPPARPPVRIDGMLASQVAPRSANLTATLGIQVYWNSADRQAELEASATRIFNYVVGLGANSVAINFFFYTDGEYPTHVYGVPGVTPRPATIALVVKNAAEHGLRVMVRPLLNDDNIKTNPRDWRGSIEPTSVSGWFASYYRFLRPYLIAAQNSGAIGFGVDTELDSLAPDKQDWAAFQAAAGKLFRGQLVYAVNYGLWQKNRPGEPVPDAAVDAYPPLDLPDNATVPQLTAAWVFWLRRHRPEPVLEKTVLQEVGISAVAGAYASPAQAAPDGTPLDISVQRKWFAAACAAAKETHMPGLYFFDVNNTDDPSNPAAAARYMPGSFIDRSDGVIKACFASGWS